MTQQIISVSIDMTAETAYLTLSAASVASTDEFDDVVLVDLDEFGVVVGIEVLDIHTDIPFGELAKRYHIKAPVLAYLLSIRDNVDSRTTATATPVASSEAFGSIALI